MDLSRFQHNATKRQSLQFNYPAGVHIDIITTNPAITCDCERAWIIRTERATSVEVIVRVQIDRVIEQLELMLDELETEATVGPITGASSVVADAGESAAVRRKSPGRRPLPEHLPRREIVHTPDCICPACGGAMRQVGDDGSEVLDYIPGHFGHPAHPAGVVPASAARA
jgi:hypothetical protein